MDRCDGWVTITMETPSGMTAERQTAILQPHSGSKTGKDGERADAWMSERHTFVPPFPHSSGTPAPLAREKASLAFKRRGQLSSEAGWRSTRLQFICVVGIAADIVAGWTEGKACDGGHTHR